MYTLIPISKKTDRMSWTNLTLQTNLTDSFYFIFFYSFMRRIIVECDCVGRFD